MNPISGFIRTLSLMIRRKVKFDKTVVNKKITMPDSKSFTIFRRVVIKNPAKAPDPKAYFIVRFKLKNMGVKENIKFSKIPMMIFMGFTGFRSKYWAVDYKTGVCQGFYEWRSVKDAENYSNSIAMKFMTKRSIPESIYFKIIDRDRESFDFKIQ